jgi:hypothetical protein
MPIKGMFTQGVCLLTDGRTTIDNVEQALMDFSVLKRTPAGQDWRFGGPAVVVAYRPEINGLVTIDVVNERWPDHMGDPKGDAMTFGAWSMGFFGPFAFPGGLERACQHSWSWADGRRVAESHRGFIRVRFGYGFGGGPDAPLRPADYDAFGELHFANRLVVALLKAPGVLCYFNPNGEVLRDEAGFRDQWSSALKQDKLPLPLWANVRFFSLSDTLGFMDTIGNQQLDVDDVEAIFPKAAYEPGVIDYYLRNVTHYLCGLKDRSIQSGEPIDGPGETNLSWTTEVLPFDKGGLVAPRRPTLRLYPSAIRPLVERTLATVSAP